MCLEHMIKVVIVILPISKKYLIFANLTITFIGYQNMYVLFFFFLENNVIKSNAIILSQLCTSCNMIKKLKINFSKLSRFLFKTLFTRQIGKQSFSIMKFRSDKVNQYSFKYCPGTSRKNGLKMFSLRFYEMTRKQ